MIKKLVLSLGILALAGCGKGASLTFSGGGLGGSNPPGGVVRDNVNMNQCQGAPPRGSSIMGEQWALLQTVGTSGSQVLNLVVEDTSTTLNVACSNAKASAQASVTASSSFKNGVLVFSAPASKTIGNQRTISCTATLDGKPSPYQLVGNCLKITLNGGTHYFTRSTLLE